MLGSQCLIVRYLLAPMPFREMQTHIDRELALSEIEYQKFVSGLLDSQKFWAVFFLVMGCLVVTFRLLDK